MTTRTSLASVLSIIGRGSVGALPLVVTAIASRMNGLEVGGEVASLLSVAYLTADLADFQAQRDVARSPLDDDARRLLSYRLSVFGAVFPLAVLLGLAVGSFSGVAAFVSAGVWIVIGNTYYGVALRRGDFATLAVGPLVGLVATVVLALLLPRHMDHSAGYAIALHAGRAIELALTAFRVGMIWPARFSLASEWRRTRHLLFSTVGSTIVGRGLTPAVHLAFGGTVAGVYAVSTQLLGGYGLLPLAIATAAFPRARGAETAREAMERMKEARLFAIRVTCIALPLVIPCALWAAGHYLGYAAPWMFWLLGISLATGILEPWIVFPTAALHASFGDRKLVLINSLGAALLAVSIMLCGWLFAEVGLAIGLCVTRMSVTAMLSAQMRSPSAALSEHSTRD